MREPEQLATSTFDVRVVARDGVDRVEISGDLHLAAAIPVRAVIDLLRPFPRPVAVDMSAVPFIDSAGLHLLAAFRQEVAAAGRSFQVCQPSAAARRVFEISGLLDVFGGTIDDAGPPDAVHSVVQSRLPGDGGWTTDVVFRFADGTEHWSIDEPVERALDGVRAWVAYQLFRSHGRLQSTTRHDPAAATDAVVAPLDASVEEPA